MKKILIGLVLVGLVFASGIVVYMFTRGSTDGYPIGQYTLLEKLAIQRVYVNGSSVSLDVTSIKENITFMGIILKNATGNVVEHTLISDYLSEGQSKTIAVNLNSTLPSGTYTATLTTVKGGSFVSPLFSVS